MIGSRPGAVEINPDHVKRKHSVFLWPMCDVSDMCGRVAAMITV